MRTRSRHVLLTLFALAVGSCAANSTSGQGPAPTAVDVVVEVTNHTNGSVTIQYYASAGSAQFIGDVSAGQRRVFNMGDTEVSSVSAIDATGRRLRREEVRIEVYRVDRATGRRVR